MKITAVVSRLLLTLAVAALSACGASGDTQPHTHRRHRRQGGPRAIKRHVSGRQRGQRHKQ